MPKQIALKNISFNWIFIFSIVSLNYFFFELQVSEPLLAKTFHRKVQSKKIFTHRESFEAIIAKTEEKLAQVMYFVKEKKFPNFAFV